MVLVNLLGGVRATVWAAVALVFLIATGVQSCRLERSHGALEDVQKAMDTLAYANDLNEKTIQKLTAANQTWADKYRADLDGARTSVAFLESERDRLERELAVAKSNRQVIYDQDPDAAAWGRTRVPAAIADSLRN